MYFNTGGHENTASGYLALQANTTGARNVALEDVTLPLDAR